MIKSDSTAQAYSADQEKRVQRLAWLLDESVRLPGGFRVGVDGLLGLVPGIGDLSGAAISAYLIYQAHQMGAPRTLLARMATNVALETTIGSIPLIGDIFDFYYKANSRNMRLLKRHLNKAGLKSQQP